MFRNTPLCRANLVTFNCRLAVVFFATFFASLSGGSYNVARGAEPLPGRPAVQRSTASSSVAVPPDAPGRVLILRGVLNVFSLGMDDLAGDLQRKGYDVRIIPPSLGFVPAVHLRETYLADPQRRPLILIGHSMGGRNCLAVAKWLEKDNIPVELVVVLDSNRNPKVPANVKRCVNLYITNPLGIFHGSPLIPEDPRTKVLNIDVTRVKRPDWAWSVDHFNIDDSMWMRQVAVNEVAAACQRAATPGGMPPLNSRKAFTSQQAAASRLPAVAGQPVTRGKLLAPVVAARQPVQNQAGQPRLMSPVFSQDPKPAFPSKPLPLQVSQRSPQSPPPMRFDENLRQSFRNVHAPAANLFRLTE